MLPEEIHLQIFKYLDYVSSICMESTNSRYYTLIEHLFAQRRPSLPDVVPASTQVPGVLSVLIRHPDPPRYPKDIHKKSWWYDQEMLEEPIESKTFNDHPIV